MPNKKNTSSNKLKISCLLEWAKEKGLPTIKKEKETVYLNEH